MAALLGSSSSSAAAAPLARSARCPNSVPAGYTCFKDGAAFAEALNAPAKAGEKLALVCPAASPCTISGTQLGGHGQAYGQDQVQATVIMQNVLMESNQIDDGSAFLAIGAGGSVTGTNLTFRNGTAGNWGGCVVSFGACSKPFGFS